MKKARPVVPKKDSKARKARPVVPKKIPWKAFGVGILLAIWVFAVSMAVQFLLSLGFVMILGKVEAAKPVWTSVFTAAYYVITAVLIILVTPKIGRKWGFLKSDRKSVGLENLPTWTDLGLGLIGFIVSLLLAAGLILVFKIFPWFNAEESQTLIYNIGIVGVDRVVAFLMLSVVAPIAEEIIFRGWLYGKLRVKLPIPVSILLVSVFFGALHSPFSASLNVFAMSVVACVLRELTGTIYAGIILHIFKNSLAFFLIFVMGA